MGVPVLLATDTTEEWNRSNVTFGDGELAWEEALQQDGTRKKLLLVGDGKPVAGNVERLRATLEVIHGLSEMIRDAIDAEAQTGRQQYNELTQAITKEAQARQKADSWLIQANRNLAGTIDAISAKQNSNNAKVDAALILLKEYQATINDLIGLIKAEHGPLGDIFLMTEEDDYLVTEEDDYLVVG